MDIANKDKCPYFGKQNREISNEIFKGREISG
jgi:hypothetical protein